MIAVIMILALVIIAAIVCYVKKDDITMWRLMKYEYNKNSNKYSLYEFGVTKNIIKVNGFTRYRDAINVIEPVKTSIDIVSMRKDLEHRFKNAIKDKKVYDNITFRIIKVSNDLYIIHADNITQIF